MSNKGLARLLITITAVFSLTACKSDGSASPVIDFDLPAGSSSIETPDSGISLSGSAASDQPVQEVTWSNSTGGTGTAIGTESWHIPHIPLVIGVNELTITASDAAGNINNRVLQVVRNVGPAQTTNDVNDPVGSGVKDPVLMYSYDANFDVSAPVDGATIDPGMVHFFVIPSDTWRSQGIDHMAYYCCDAPGGASGNASSLPKMAVSYEPWSMIIDLSDLPLNTRRTIDIEANLNSGAISKPSEYNFTLAGGNSGTNRAPTISGKPPGSVQVGQAFDFRPNADDRDDDTLSFSVSALPRWAKFDKLTGRIWGTPTANDVTIYRNIRISVSDGKTQVSLPSFSIEVKQSTSSASPPQTSGAPTIASFTTSTNVINAGGSATLRWSVNDATSVTISPAPGRVQGSSVQVYPTTSTRYTLTATNSTGSTSASLTVSVLTGSSDWNVTKAPPVLSNPRIVDVSNLGTSNIGAVGLTCGGKIHRINLGGGEDALVHMSGNQPLRYPLHVTGGRNVRIIGLQFDLATQQGCGIGELPNNPVADHPNASIHPRVPGAIAVRVKQSGVSFIEGLHIDVKGHEADCIVSRNPDSMTDSQARSQRDVIIQNTYCSGVEGLGQSDIGDGIHGDLFQNQGKDILRHLVFENVSMRTSQEGIVIHKTPNNPGTKTLLVRRYDYTWDPRYVGDDSYEGFGSSLAGFPGPDWTLEDVWIDDYRKGGDFVKIDGQRYGSQASGNILKHPEIHSGLPPQGAFALPGRTGINYVSPHGGVP